VLGKDLSYCILNLLIYIKATLHIRRPPFTILSFEGNTYTELFKFVHDYNVTHSFSEDLGKIIPAYILVNTVSRKQTVQEITMN